MAGFRDMHLLRAGNGFTVKTPLDGPAQGVIAHAAARLAKHGGVYPPAKTPVFIGRGDRKPDAGHGRLGCKRPEARDPPPESQQIAAIPAAGERVFADPSDMFFRAFLNGSIYNNGV
jgi:hypothetical protein